MAFLLVLTVGASKGYFGAAGDGAVGGDEWEPQRQGSGSQDAAYATRYVMHFIRSLGVYSAYRSRFDFRQDAHGQMGLMMIACSEFRGRRIFLRGRGKTREESSGGPTAPAAPLDACRKGRSNPVYSVLYVSLEGRFRTMYQYVRSVSKGVLVQCI